MQGSRPTYPLTLSQLLIWAAEVLLASPPQQVCWMVKLGETLHIERWIEAIRQVISDDEGLRLRMIRQDGDVRQYVAPDQKVEVSFLDFSHPGGADEFRQWVERETRKRWPIIDSTLFYFFILRLGRDDHRLFVKVHHLVADGWSVTVLVEQIFKRYRALQTGEALNEAPPGSFVDYIVRQTDTHTPEMAEQFVHYVSRELIRAPVAVRIRPDLPATVDVKASRKTFTIPPTLRTEIVRFSESHHTSVYLFFLTGILLYISMVNATEDAAVCTLFHNRLDPAYQNTVGMFSTILPLRVNVADDLSFSELSRRVLSEWKQSIQRQPASLSLQDLVTVHQHLATFFDVLVSYESHLPGEAPEWFHGEADLHLVSLAISILDYPTAGLERHQVDMEFRYRTGLFSEADIAVIYQQLMNLWAELLADPHQKIGELRLRPCQ